MFVFFLNNLIQQLSIDDFEGTNYAANSLKKAYLCHAPIKQIVPGSIVLFYASGVKKAITCLGIVDATFNKFNNFDEMRDLVKRRTAYSEEMLKNNFNDNILVIMFKHYCSFNNYIPFDFLLKEKIVNGNIQSIIEIKKVSDLQKIMKYAKFDENKYLIKNE